MMKEIEVKAVLGNPEALIEKLVSMGCELKKASREVDTYYRHINVENPHAEGDILLRIRQKDGRKIFTLKQALSTPLACTEHETEIVDAESMNQIILCLDYVKYLEITKTRTKTMYQGMEICIDDVDELGHFVEVEKLSEGADEKMVQNDLSQFLVQLGIERDAHIEKSYTTLMKEFKAL